MSISEQSIGVLATYTVLSWIMNCIRFAISALAPFLSDHHMLLQIHRILRFPALMTATVTFTIWNFALIPFFVTVLLDTREKRIEFAKSNFSFRMVQQHICCILLAMANAIVSCTYVKSPLQDGISTLESRAVAQFTFDDLWCGLTYAILYGLFYNLVLDRFGLHFYPIFSPRTNYSIITWVVVLAMFLGFFRFWNMLIMNYLDELTLSLMLRTHFSVTALGLLAKFAIYQYECKYMKGKEKNIDDVIEVQY